MWLLEPKLPPRSPPAKDVRLLLLMLEDAVVNPEAPPARAPPALLPPLRRRMDCCSSSSTLNASTGVTRQNWLSLNSSRAGPTDARAVLGGDCPEGAFSAGRAAAGVLAAAGAAASKPPLP